MFRVLSRSLEALMFSSNTCTLGSSTVVNAMLDGRVQCGQGQEDSDIVEAVAKTSTNIRTALLLSLMLYLH